MEAEDLISNLSKIHLTSGCNDRKIKVSFISHAKKDN